jgi:hypothetical protein
MRDSLSREELRFRSREGSLASGLSADYSGGTAAESHGLPRFPCLPSDCCTIAIGLEYEV